MPTFSRSLGIFHANFFTFRRNFLRMFCGNFFMRGVRATFCQRNIIPENDSWFEPSNEFRHNDSQAQRATRIMSVKTRSVPHSQWRCQALFITACDQRFGAPNELRRASANIFYAPCQRLFLYA